MARTNDNKAGRRPGGDYWFARRYPVGQSRGGMSPVSPEGWRVVRRFVLLMMLGGAIFAAMGMAGAFARNAAAASVLLVTGAVIFALIAAFAGTYFIRTAARHSDPIRTVADYRKAAARSGR